MPDITHRKRKTLALYCRSVVVVLDSMGQGPGPYLHRLLNRFIWIRRDPQIRGRGQSDWDRDHVLIILSISMQLSFFFFFYPFSLSCPSCAPTANRHCQCLDQSQCINHTVMGNMITYCRVLSSSQQQHLIYPNRGHGLKHWSTSCARQEVPVSSESLSPPPSWV